MVAEDGDGPALAQALEGLASSDPDRQRASALELARLGSPEALPALIGAFRTENWLVRGAAVRAILAIGGAEALGDFAQALHEGDARIRAAAVEIFRGLGRRVSGPLQELLDDDDANVVRYAAEILGEIGDPDATERLVTLARSHEDEDVRYQVILSLGQLGPPGPQVRASVVDVLARALDDSLWVQTAALEAIGMVGLGALEGQLIERAERASPWALAAMLDALGRVGTSRSVPLLYRLATGGGEAAGAALGALADVARGSEKELALDGDERASLAAAARRALASEESPVRLAAIFLAGRLGDAKAAAALVDILNTEAAEELSEEEQAAGALARIGPGVEALLVGRFAELDVTAQILAIEVLGEVGGARAGRLLMQLLDHEDGEINRAACEALGRIGDPDFAEALIFQFQHPSGAVRSAAQQALARLPAEAVFDKLLALLCDPLAEVRAMAAATLGSLGDGRAVGPLKHLLIDPSNEVKQGAVFALSALEERKVGSLPLLLLGNDDPVLRRSAAQVLGHLQDRRAVEPLMYILGDSDLWVRFQTARALGEIGDARAVGPLLECLGDEVGPVRIAAAEALARLRGEGAARALLVLLADPDPDVRVAVVELIGAFPQEAVREGLCRAAGDDSWKVRHAALRLLAARPDERALALVRQCLRDEHVLVRRAAGELIEGVERAVGIGDGQ